jgi:hypothetical protein
MRIPRYARNDVENVTARRLRLLRSERDPGEDVADQDEEHPLSPNLEATQLQLQSALDEVCDDVEIETAETDELIRIEETLAIASDAAKRAISLRQRIDADEPS